MNRIKKLLGNILHSPSLPLYIFIILVLWAHLFMSDLFSDDIWFYNVLEGKDDMMGAWREFLEFRYENWSSRTAIEGALILLVRVMPLWKIIDSVAIIYIVFEISRLVNPEKSLVKNIIIVLLVPAYPVWVLYEVGFVATSINYIIPFACLFPTLSIIYRRAQGRGVPIFEYFLAIPFLAFACFSEIVCAILLVVSLGAITLYLIEKKKIPYFEIFALIFCILLLVYHLSCPGNDFRYTQETNNWLPEHSSLNIIEKALLGFNAMTSTMFFYDKNLLVCLFCITISVATILKSNKWYLRAISLVGTVFSLTFGLLYPILGKIPFISRIGDAMMVALHSPSPTLGSIAMVLLAIVLLATLLVCMLFIIDKRRDYFMIFFALAAGAISKIALGLSPTVWTGAGRASTYLYLAISIATGMVIYQVYLIVKNEIKKA
ncbi:MAG: hypothetical protein E7622_03755 [Ruminococcaceae bacterium]|nr:hypothetical protein [Oscillospiraceae bacterium]